MENYSQSRHISTFLHYLMLHLNGLSIISKFHLTQLTLQTRACSFQIIKSKMKTLEIQTSYQDINKHTFPQIMFFIIFLAKILLSFSSKHSGLKFFFFCHFLCHCLQRSHNFLTFLTQKPTKAPHCWPAACKSHMLLPESHHSYQIK